MQNLAQFEYNTELASMCGDVEPTPKWRQALYVATGASKRASHNYRDLGLDAGLMEEARSECGRQVSVMEAQAAAALAGRT